MRWRVIARYRSQVSTMAFILFRKLITEALNIHSELVCNHVACPRIVIVSVVAVTGIGPSMRQLFVETELLCHKGPVFVESLEFSDEIGQHISVGIDKPIQLKAMRSRVNAGCAAVLDPIDKLFEGHLVPDLSRFGTLIQRDNAV